MKKGISPLIATVLLVGFVVTLSVIVFTYTGKSTERMIENVGGRINPAIECANGIDLRITSIVQVDDVISFNVESYKGDLDRLLISVICEDGFGFVKNIEAGVEDGGIKRLNLDEMDCVVKNIVFTPQIVSEDRVATCSDYDLEFNL